MTFIAGTTAVSNTRNLAQSALPDAPRQPHHDERSRQGAWLGVALRTVARRALRLADRLDPAPTSTYTHRTA